MDTIALSSAHQAINTELTIACQPRSLRLHYPDQFRLASANALPVVDFKRVLDNNPQLKGRLTDISFPVALHRPGPAHSLPPIAWKAAHRGSTPN
jgi:hypothetical protein